MDQAHAAPDVDPAALDSGSELSDLTEDDLQPSASGPHHASQDAPRQRRKKRRLNVGGTAGRDDSEDESGEADGEAGACWEWRRRWATLRRATRRGRSVEDCAEGRRVL